MQYTKDTANRGHVFTFDSLAQAADFGVASGRKPGGFQVSPSRDYFVGRSDLGTWDGVDRATRSPWAAGAAVVAGMVEKIKQVLEVPADLRRRGYWSDVDGEVAIDRALHGDPEYMRATRRKRASGSRNVVVLCNIGESCNATPEEIFWRGAATVAAVDLLEDAGYACEVWGWASMTEVYKRHEAGGTGGFFYAAKVKESGDPVNVDALVCGLSGWWFRTVVFGVATSLPHWEHHLGFPIRVPGAFEHHMDVARGVQRVYVPRTRTEAEAVAATKELLGLVDAGTAQVA